MNNTRSRLSAKTSTEFVSIVKAVPHFGARPYLPGRDHQLHSTYYSNNLTRGIRLSVAGILHSDGKMWRLHKNFFPDLEGTIIWFDQHLVEAMPPERCVLDGPLRH